MQDLIATIGSQFANSPTILRLIQNFNAYIDPAADIQNFYDLIWNVDTAVGYGLDVWGRIVGVNRVFQVPTGTVFLGFHSDAGASGDAFNGAPFYAGQQDTNNYALTDDAFRTLILAKALFNICDGSVPATNQILIEIFGKNGVWPQTSKVYVRDNHDMTMNIVFASTPDPVAYGIVANSGVIPKPAGVASTIVVLSS